MWCISWCNLWKYFADEDGIKKLHLILCNNMEANQVFFWTTEITVPLQCKPFLAARSCHRQTANHIEISLSVVLRGNVLCVYPSLPPGKEKERKKERERERHEKWQRELLMSERHKKWQRELPKSSQLTSSTASCFKNEGFGLINGRFHFTNSTVCIPHTTETYFKVSNCQKVFQSWQTPFKTITKI